MKYPKFELYNKVIIVKGFRKGCIGYVVSRHRKWHGLCPWDRAFRYEVHIIEDYDSYEWCNETYLAEVKEISNYDYTSY